MSRWFRHSVHIAFCGVIYHGLHQLVLQNSYCTTLSTPQPQTLSNKSSPALAKGLGGCDAAAGFDDPKSIDEAGGGFSATGLAWLQPPKSSSCVTTGCAVVDGILLSQPPVSP